MADVSEDGAEVISLTHGRCWSVEMRGFVRVCGVLEDGWQTVEGGCSRLLTAVAAISCVSWTGNQPSGLLTGEEPCRSMNG